MGEGKFCTVRCKLPGKLVPLRFCRHSGTIFLCIGMEEFRCSWAGGPCSPAIKAGDQRLALLGDSSRSRSLYGRGGPSALRAIRCRVAGPIWQHEHSRSRSLCRGAWARQPLPPPWAGRKCVRPEGIADRSLATDEPYRDTLSTRTRGCHRLRRGIREQGHQKAGRKRTRGPSSRRHCDRRCEQAARRLARGVSL